jgi:hypothetical protein
MPTIETTVHTERAERYLAQFCKHATAMGGSGGHRPRLHMHGRPGHVDMQAHAEWSETRGVITFAPDGRCTMDADATTLTVRVEADDEEALVRIQDIVAQDLARFSSRDPLTLSWHRPV